MVSAIMFPEPGEPGEVPKLGRNIMGDCAVSNGNGDLTGGQRGYRGDGLGDRVELVGGNVIIPHVEFGRPR
jgi:hypothetical protein